MFRVFWEQGKEEEEEEEKEAEAEVSLHVPHILRLLTSLIHYCGPPSIIDEQVQCQTAPEPTLPMLSPSTTNAIATSTAIAIAIAPAIAALPETSTTPELLYHRSGLWPT